MIKNRLLLIAVSVLFFSTSRFAYGLEPNWSDNIDDGDIRTLCENLQAGDEAYVMRATDTTKIVYSILNEDSVDFEMCPDNGTSTGRVCAKQDLNRETVASYEVTEVAADADNLNDKIQRTINVNLNDANDNQPIFQGLPYIFYLHEGSEAGTVAGQVDATDADQQFASNVDMFLQEDRGVLELTSNTAVPTNVTITETLDYEKSPIYIGVLTAKDRGDVSVECGELKSLSAETAVYLNVYDGPDTPPEFTSRQYSGSVKENAADLTEPLTVEANDGDYGLRWAIKYTLSNYDDIFSIGEDSGTLTVRDGSKIDRESDGVSDGFYTLNVTATEIKPENFSEPAFDDFPGPQSSSVIVTIFVEDINDNGPVFYTDSTYQFPTPKYNITISESTRGTIPDLLIYVKDNDQRENAEFNLEIIGDDGRYFELSSENVISEASLSLKVKSDEELDYETKRNLNFEISATDVKNLIMSKIQMLITLTDENDNSPNFITTNVEVDIPEHSKSDYMVTVIKADDADSGENAIIQYSLQPENSGFRIDEGTGKVSVAPGSSLDRETRAQYFLTVIATDTGGLINTTQLTVTLTDINDQTPGFLQTQYIINWDENDASPDPLEVEALDSDDATTNNSKMEIYFADPEVNSRFQIIEDSDGSGGVIRASITPTVPLDAEVLPGTCFNGIIEFELEVSVRDKGSPSKSSNATITIFLRGVNDHAPIFNGSMYIGSVNEGTPQGTAVAKVFASDGDKCETNNEITFTVDNEFADSFLMGLSEDGESVLQVRRPLDRDAKGFYDVVVYAVDSGRPQMSSNATVRVEVLDVNDKDPFFVDESQLEITVNESAKIDEVIGSVFADDTDINSNLSFSIDRFRCINENDVDVGDSICTDWFSISSKDQVGNISVNSELDRETVETVVLTVQVEDMNAETGQQIATTTVTVLINDYNDNAPDITEPDGPFAVIEQLSVGTVIGRLFASDIDKDNTVTFFVDSPFVNISADGEITVNGVIDREGVPGSNFSAFINARDNGVPSMTSQIEVKFDVVDANDHDPSFGDSTSFTCEIKENEAEGTSVCTINATDEDIGDNALLTYSIQTADAPFIVNSTTGQIFSDRVFNQEDINSYQFKFRARDTAGDLARESEVDVIVNILDLDDNEPTYKDVTVQNPQELSITEENDENLNIGTVQEAFDADTEENQKNSYFLLYDDDADFSDVFSLDRTTRNLTAKPTLDREEKGSYTLYVLTTKNDSIASTNYQDYVEDFAEEILTVNVVVEDINDNAPVFERAADTTDLLYATSYGENNIVTIVTATDPDAGENAILTYSIVSERYFRPDSTVAAEVGGPYFAIDSGNGQVKTTAISFETEITVGGLFKLVIEVVDGGGLSDQMNLDIKIFDETETVILESRYNEEYLEARRDQIEIDLEKTLDADVVIDKIVPKEVQNQVARATTNETQITEIHFHATEWNSTRLIPAEEIAAELDSNQNNDLLITWAIVSIGTSEVETGPTISETDLLKAILAVVSAVLLLFLLVLAIAFVCMRRSYKRKIKAAEAGQETALAVEEQRVPKMSVNIPNTNQNAVGENMLYLESQKNTISMDAWQKLAESSDDNNSIDDNAVDSQDSAISEGRQASFNGDDLDDVEIDFPADDLSNLQNALNRRGNDMVFENNYTGMDDTTAM